MLRLLQTAPRPEVTRRCRQRRYKQRLYTCLQRGFGIVAANRGVKTRGPYRLVRHPAYLGYLVSYLGYVAENPSVANFALLCLSTGFQLVRIREEEQLLRSDLSYESYRSSVRHKLIPLVY